MRSYAQKFLDKGKDFNVQMSIKSSFVSDSFNYALATGNWGDQTKASQVRNGVSQVCDID